MSAQRDVLNDLVPKLAAVPGLVFEFGLGSGRTYDHLREVLPGRRIVVFESVVAANPVVRLCADDLMVGDIRETASRFPDGSAALVHVDIETGVAAIDAELASWLPGLVARLLVPGGYGASGAALQDPRLVPCPLPPGVPAGRYHLVRRRADIADGPDP